MLYNKNCNNINTNNMLTMHLLSRNIRTQIILPLQRLSVTFNTVRLNSSSSGSSSDSDSDSDPDSSKEKRFINTDDATKDKSFKRADYLSVTNEKYKRKIEKELGKAADTLLHTTTEKDKEKIISNILTTISLMQSAYPSNTSNNRTNKPKINHKQNYNKKEEGPSVIKTLQSEQQKSKSAENQFRTKRAEGEPSIIKTLQSEQQKLKHAVSQLKTKYVKEEPSVIKTLQSEQQKLKHVESRLRTKHDVEEEPSVIKTLQSEQQKLKHVESRLRTKHDVEEEPSVIKTLQSEQQKLKHAESRLRTKHDVEEEPSVIRTLKSEQQKSKHAESRSITKHDVEEEPSVIRTLKSEQQKSKHAESRLRTKHDVEEEPSVIRTLKSEQRKIWRSKVKHDEEEERDDTPINYEPIFVGEFTETSVVPEFKIWDKCEENELQTLMVRYPKNAFEEMIKWTEEGKLWRFPIDNEQGMEEEKEIHFSKHVFLEKHLEGWCPVNGPIRHFMELVCVGLSKNPYMTVKEKEDHIMWYKDYFGSKEDLLKNLGAIE